MDKSTIRSILMGTLELTDEQLEALVEKMWRLSLDPRTSADVARGIEEIGLNAQDFSIE